jgi:hypothetical protein
LIEPRFHRAQALLIAFLAIQGCPEAQKDIVEEDVLQLPADSDVIFQIPFVDDLGNPNDANDDTSDGIGDTLPGDAIEDVPDVADDVGADIIDDAPDIPPVDPCETIDCDDNNVCTADSCVAPGDCNHVAIEAPCDDGNACTELDTCTEGSCESQAVECDDGNPCTNEVCLTTVGCSYAPTGGICADGDGTCADGACSAYTCPDESEAPCPDGMVFEGDATIASGGDLLALHGHSLISGDLIVSQGMSQIILPNLKHVGGSLKVVDTMTLSKLQLPALLSIAGAITITGNDALAAFLVPALAGSTGEVQIQDNPLLPECLALAVLTQIQAPLATVNGNCTDCPPCE